MKNTMKTLLALMAGVMTFSACSNEDVLTNETPNPEAKPILSFKAATENNTATRATIDGLDIKWQAGDAILMMDGTNNSKYNLTAGETTASGTFDVDGESTAVEGVNIYALYPYSEGSSRPATIEDAQAAAEGFDDVLDRLSSWKDDIDVIKTQAPQYLEDELSNIKDKMNYYGVSSTNQAIIIAYLLGENIETPAPALSGSSITNLTIPAVQTVAAGQTVDPNAVLMVAKADGEDLAFKNVCSYVKVTPTVACKKIEVRAMDADLAGTCTVAVSDEPTASITSGGKSVVTLQAQSGDLAAGTYYIAVLPGTKSNGIEVRFYTGGNETFNYNIRSMSFEFVRSKVHSGGNNSGATAAIWSYYTESDRWAFDYSPEEAKTVTIKTGVSGAMPSGAKALNSDETLWVRKDAVNNYFIETSASKIVATNMYNAFNYLQNVESYTGLDNLDVSEVSNFYGCFRDNRYKLASLDLSSWQINPAASTRYMFSTCMSLSSLTLNNSFHSGGFIINRIGQTLPDGQYCIIYGVTDEAVKNELRNGKDDYITYDPTYTKFKFDGE